MLSLTIETLVATSKATVRQCDPIALSGCVSEIAVILADCAVKPLPEGGAFCWISAADKKLLSLWIAQRIWRMAGALKNGRTPEALARLAFFPVEEAKPNVRVVSEELNVGQEDGRIYRKEGDFEYHAIAVKAGRMYRIHLRQELDHDAYVMKIAEGRIVKFVVAMYKEPYAIRLGSDDAANDHMYTSVEKFIEEAIINGLQQEGGVVDYVGSVPDLISPSYTSSHALPPTHRDKFAPVGVKAGDLARGLGVPCKVVIDVARSLNIDAKNASYVFMPGQADRIQAKMKPH